MTGARTAQGIVESAMSNLRTLVNERLSGKSGGGGGGGGGQSSGGGKKTVGLNGAFRWHTVSQ